MNDETYAPGSDDDDNDDTSPYVAPCWDCRLNNSRDSCFYIVILLGLAMGHFLFPAGVFLADLVWSSVSLGGQAFIGFCCDGWARRKFFPVWGYAPFV